MKTCLAVSLVFSLSPCLKAQDILHYKFDAGCGTEVLNYAVGSPLGHGTLRSTLPGSPSTSWTTGRFGNALSGSIPGPNGGGNYVENKWVDIARGSFSVAMWIRNRPGNPATIAYGHLFGGALRCTIVGGRLVVAAWAGVPPPLVSSDLTARLNAGYVHVAVVLDAKNLTGTFYIDGVPEAPQPLTIAPNFQTSPFTVGAYFGVDGSQLDMDEFMLSNRVFTAAEIQRMAGSSPARVTTFGNRSQGILAAGGNPTLGNTAFFVALRDAPGQQFLLFAGSNRCSLGGQLSLPGDLGGLNPSLAGTTAYTDIDLFSSAGPLPPTGHVQRLGIPMLPALNGFTAYVQAYTVTAQQELRTTNALAISIGR